MDFDTDGDISGQLEEINLGPPPAAVSPPLDMQSKLDSAGRDDQRQDDDIEGAGDMGWTPPVHLAPSGVASEPTAAPEHEARAEGASAGPSSSASIDEDGEDRDDGDTTTAPSTPPLSDSVTTTPAHSSVSALPPASPPSTAGKSALPSSVTAIPLAVESSASAEGVATPVESAQEPPAVTAEKAEKPSAPATPTAQPRLATSTPNVLQRLVSMTRQRDLPPKAKEEEKKHLRELEEMRTAAKEAEKRHQASLASARALRSQKLAAALPTWTSQILPNWRAALAPTADGTALRKLWWEGTMPVRMRGRIWGMCIGNGLAVSKSAFNTALGRWSAVDGGAEKEQQEKLEAERRMKEDVEHTLVEVKLFQEGGVMHEELCDLLRAAMWWLATRDGRRGKLRYPEGLASPTAMLLVNLPVPDAWVSLVNLINKSYLGSFYSEDTEECEAYYRIFDTLLADSMPKIYENFSKEVVRPALYLFPWLTTVYVRYLPLDLSTRLFDIFLLEGDSFIFRVALVLLQLLEPRLFNPVLSELDAVFKGEDRGAVAIVRRQRGFLGGEEEKEVTKEEVYEEMGISERAVFEGLEGLNWREETWERLVTRELPEAD